jgi:hypothetical protein
MSDRFCWVVMQRMGLVFGHPTTADGWAWDSDGEHWERHDGDGGWEACNDQRLLELVEDASWRWVPHMVFGCPEKAREYTQARHYDGPYEIQRLPMSKTWKEAADV